MSSRLTGGTTITVGAAILGLLLDQRVMTHLALSREARIGGFVLAGLVMLGGMIIWMWRGLQATWEKVGPMFRWRTSLGFKCVQATTADLAVLHEFYKRYFGNDIPSVAAMANWHKRNEETFWVLTHVWRSRLGTRSSDLVGSFKICYVHAGIVDLLDREKVTGASFPGDAIVSKRDAAALYVGDVAAKKGSEERGYLIGRLDGQIAEARNRGLPIYARPLSDEGLGLMKGHGFQMVSDIEGSSPRGRIHRLLPDARVRRGLGRGTRIQKLGMQEQSKGREQWRGKQRDNTNPPTT